MFEYSYNDIFSQLALLPTHLKFWLAWLGIVTFLIPLAFFRDRTARIILLFQLGNAVLGSILGLTFGLVRLLGLAHIVFWTPLVIYTVRHLPTLPRNTLLGIWVRVFLVTVLASLFLDYIDVVWYTLGDRNVLVEGWTR